MLIAGFYIVSGNCSLTYDYQSLIFLFGLAGSTSYQQISSLGGNS